MSRRKMRVALSGKCRLMADRGSSFPGTFGQLQELAKVQGYGAAVGSMLSSALGQIKEVGRCEHRPNRHLSSKLL